MIALVLLFLPTAEVQADGPVDGGTGNSSRCDASSTRYANYTTCLIELEAGTPSFYNKYAPVLRVREHALAVCMDRISNQTSSTIDVLACDVTHTKKAAANKVIDGVKQLIYVIFVKPLADIFTWVGGSFITAVLSPELYKAIFKTDQSNELLYSMWRLVRNLLNVLFIFVLLLSAFSTIFQIQKWHLKQVLVKLVIMAMLVNFSWPITRVFIDTGNVLMYGIINLQVQTDSTGGQATGGANIAGLLAGEADIIQAIAKDPGENKGITVTDVLVSGVFILLFVVTFMTIGLIFLLRVVMFVLLLIFSPVGFAAAIFPGTQRFANMWWEALLKWTFIGPVLVLILFISLAFMTKMKGALSTVANGTNTTAGTFGADFGATMILYVAALAILWAGIAAAGQIGGGIATAAMNRSRKVGSWGARKTWNGAKRFGRGADNLSVAAQKKATGGKSVSVAGGLGRIRGLGKGLTDASKRSDALYGQRKAYGQAAGAAVTGSKHAVQTHKKKEKARFKDEDFKHASTKEIIDYAADGTNQLRQEAAREHLASQKDTIKDSKTFSAALKAMGNDVDNAAKMISNATTPGAFSGVDTSDYRDLKTSIGTSGMNAGEQERITKDVDKKYTENKNVHILVTHDVASGVSPEDALADRLNIPTKDIAAQNKMWAQIKTDTTLQNHLRDNYVGNPQLHQDLFKQMSPTSRKELTDVGLSP